LYPVAVALRHKYIIQIIVIARLVPAVYVFALHRIGRRGRADARIAIFSCFAVVIARCFSLLFWCDGEKKARVSAAESGRAAVFFRHYQRHQRAAARLTITIAVLLSLFFRPEIQGFQ
jgi:hypothetical protein